MQLESLRLTNFRCFGAETCVISFEPQVTALIGANGSGKTAVMTALLRLIGTTADTRRVTRRDFHVPLDEKTPPRERSLSIDAIFAFPELDEDNDGDASASVPTYFEQMGADDEGTLKFRLRLDAAWTDDGSDEGVIAERLRAITTLEDDFDEDTDCRVVSPLDRARIQLLYIPASRDGASQLTSFLRGRLWRAILWSQDIRDAHADSAATLNDAFADETAVKRISKALKARWQALHTGGVDASPILGPVDVRFDRFIRRIEVAFHPDESGRMRDLHELSDGQRSLFHLAMTATALDVEAKAAANPKGFDPDALYLPALTILAFEEPENNLAPFFLSRIIRQLQDLTVSPACQAVISSHSASILARIEPEQVRHFRLEDESRTAVVSSVELPEDSEEASKFVREAVKAYPELYFASFVVLGEGSSEEVVIPRLAEAMGFPIDRSFVAVVPLGGRHVNHLWRLLRGLEIPFATLLDNDFGRSGGGWDRIKNAYKQLVAIGTPKDDIRPAGWKGGFDKTLAGLDDTQREQAEKEWLEKLQTHGVFFCNPLDLDMTMLEALPDEYRALEPGMKGPSKVGEAAIAVLGKDGDPDVYDTAGWDDNFHWYRYLFLGRGKPTTHMRVLSTIDDDKLARDAPDVLKSLLTYVTSALDLKAVTA